MAGPTIIRVAVVGEDPLARAGLVALFVSHGELALVGQGSPIDAGRLSADADARRSIAVYVLRMRSVNQ